MEFHTVLGITAIFHVTSNISKIVYFRKGFDKKLAVSLGVPAVIFVIIGSILSKYFDARILTLALSFFLILISLFLLLFRSVVIAPTVSNSVLGGIISGFAAGLLGTGGAIRGLTLAAFSLKTEVFLATSAVIDLGIDASRSLVYYLNGFIHRSDLYLIAILVVVSIAGTWIGGFLLKKISDTQFKKIVLILILLTGIMTLIKSIS